MASCQSWLHNELYNNHIYCLLMFAWISGSHHPDTHTIAMLFMLRISEQWGRCCKHWCLVGLVWKSNWSTHFTVSHSQSGEPHGYSGLVGNCRMQHRYTRTGVTRVLDGTQQNGADGLRFLLTCKRKILNLLLKISVNIFTVSISNWN